MDLLDLTYAPQIMAAAGRLEHSAATIRQRAALLATATATCEWDGVGARGFRHRSQATTTRLRRAAGDLETAAAALRRHADRVADAVARDLAGHAR